MEHIFHISDEQYAKLAAYAARRKQTSETLFQDWVKAVARDVEHLPSPHGQPPAQEQPAAREAELLNGPLFQVAGMFAIGEPGWADKHDESLAETYLEDHANSN